MDNQFPEYSEILTTCKDLNARALRLLSYPIANSDREHLCLSIGGVANEHSYSLILLLENELQISAVSLLRLQYEATIRMLWSYYVASDAHIKKLSSKLTDESARKAANSTKILSELLGELEDECPTEMLEALKDFKDSSWKDLNSYVHSGIHATHIEMNGMPVKVAVAALAYSSLLLHIVATMPAVMLASKVESQELTEEISSMITGVTETSDNMAGFSLGGSKP